MVELWKDAEYVKTNVVDSDEDIAERPTTAGYNKLFKRPAAAKGGKSFYLFILNFELCCCCLSPTRYGTNYGDWPNSISHYSTLRSLLCTQTMPATPQVLL